MKQDYTMAYPRCCAGLRDGTTKPLTADEGRTIQRRVDAIIDDILES